MIFIKKLSMNVDWLNISPLEGPTGNTEIYAYVTENEKIGSTRWATVEFINQEGLTAQLTLTQTSNTEDMRFVVTPDYLYVQGGGGTFYVNILSNTYWKVSNYDCGINITTDNEDGYGDAIVKIVFPRNPNTNNQYGYDHMGRPFYGREGYITITSLMGTKQIFWEQAAYEAITVTPNKLYFPETGGSMTVTVSSSTDWTLTSYDSATTSFSALSGHSGATEITVSKIPLTQAQIEYYVTCPSQAVFSDGSNTAVLSIDSTLDNYYIDDDWITVTYDVPSANTDVILYAYESDLAITPTVQFQDANHSEIKRKSVQLSYERFLGQYYTTFTTAGEHIVKYKYNKEGTIIPKFGFPAGNILGVSGQACYKKIVIGNRCSGVIAGCAAKGTGFEEVILGTGNITLIGEAAFSGCGSYDKDFILPNGVQDIMYCPFMGFKARKFIYDMDYWGGDNASEEKSNQSNIKYTTQGLLSLFTVLVYGSSYGSQNRFVASGSHYNWSKYPGPIDCRELVIGQNVKVMYSNGIYPFGYIWSESSDSVSITKPGMMYSFSVAAAPIKCNSIAMLRKTPPQTPSGINTNMTRTRQTFTVGTDETHYFDFGFLPSSKPFHYPIGSNYSAWTSIFTNHYEDLDI